ncbi:MAG TPA: glycosyltransferase, partial [Acidimicrobiales bacterium]|nr:glycosyltransferase [Acidimicrobiales bacterium]
MTKPLVVSIDVSSVPARPAGAGRYVVDLVAALAERDDLDLALIARRDDGARWTSLARRAEVRAIAPVSRPLRLAWEQVALPRIVDRIAPHCHHGPHYTMPERAAPPKVVTIHDLTFFDNPEWHERAKVPVFRRAIKVAARHADGLVCVSEATAARLRALLSPRGEVRVIPHGLDHDRFHARAQATDGEIIEALGIASPYV